MNTSNNIVSVNTKIATSNIVNIEKPVVEPVEI